LNNNNNNNTFVERYSAIPSEVLEPGGTGKLAISIIEQVSFKPRCKYRESVTVDDNKRQTCCG